MCHSEFLLFINYKQAEIFKLHFLTKNSVRADDDIDLTFLQPLKRFLLLFCGFAAIDIVNRYREIFQAVLESFIVLKSKNGSRYQDCRLLSVEARFECGTNRDLSL